MNAVKNEWLETDRRTELKRKIKKISCDTLKQNEIYPH